MSSSAGSRAMSSRSTLDSPLAAIARTCGAMRANSAGSFWCVRSCTTKLPCNASIMGGHRRAAVSTWGRSVVMGSHPRVVRPAAAFGRHPDDVLGRVLDVAGLAVHAVLCIDLQPVAVVGVLHELVHAGRAVAALRTGVAREVHVDRYGS